jgi:hypothetical protein
MAILKGIVLMNSGLKRQTTTAAAGRPGSAVMLALLAMFAFSIILDTVATQFMVSRGIVQEGNPVMASLISSGQFVGFKLLGLLLCSALLWLVYRRFPRLSVSAVLGSLLLCTGILFWNTLVITGLA